MSELDYRRALKALPLELSPERDLWAGIEARIRVSSPRQRHRPLWLGLAIAAGISCLVVVLSLRGLGHGTRFENSENAVAQAEMPWVLREAKSMRVEVDAALATGANGEAEQAVREPGRLLSASLRELDSAEIELDQALNLNPESTFLLERLRRVQQQKARLTLRALTA